MVPGGSLMLDAIGLWNEYWSARRGENVDGEDDPEAHKPIPPPLEMSGGGMGGGMIPGGIETEMMESGVYGVGAAGAGAMATGSQPVSVGITINGDVDSAQRVAVIMRQVEMAQRNMYRGTINTLVDPRMFPN